MFGLICFAGGLRQARLIEKLANADQLLFDKEETEMRPNEFLIFS